TNATNATMAANATNGTATPDFEKMIAAARAAMTNGKYKAAYDTLKGIKDDPELPQEFKEDVLYDFADAAFHLFQDDIEGHVREVLTAYERAMNYNPESPRTPQALLNMGYVNLQADNIPEARGYFNLLREDYPDDPNVPLTHYYWGRHQLKNGQYQEAAEAFEQIIQDYPDNKIAKNAAVGLARSLRQLEYFDEAQEIIDYIRQRWPRYYLDDPDFLEISGFVAQKNKDFDTALNNYWAYINLAPESGDTDIIQARIGDVYLQKENKEAAREIYEKTASEFPEREGGLIASMRLAEEGIYDEPSIEDMFSVFDRPFNLRPEKIYSRIINDFPDSPLAPVAQLKLAMWELFNGRAEEALREADNFLRNYPDSDLTSQAIDVGMKAFSRLAAKYGPDSGYKQILNAWNEYTFLQDNKDKMPSDTRLAVATALWQDKKSEQAVAMARPLLSSSKKEEVDKGQTSALGLLLNIHLDRENWLAITKLAEQATDWDLPQKQKHKLDYAYALALQNMGRSEQAMPVWRSLASDIDLSGTERAYALYFMARHAFDKQDYENVHVFAQEALSLFLQDKNDISKIKACLELLIQTTESTGRLKEALGWALEYETFVDKDDSDWPAFQYTLAGLYKKNGDREKWRASLEELIEADPESMFADMARSELNTDSIEIKAREFLSDS
ncbi:MAG: tetratricopeptide repeat protein, partial [Desulfonatronovibrionaceae bacterium]